MMDVYVCRADYGKYTENFKEYSCVGIGWFINIDPERNDWDLKNKEFLKTKYREMYPDDIGMKLHQNVGQIDRFLHECNIGDLIITPYRSQKLLIGKLTSDFIFQRDQGFPYTWRKNVQWLLDDVSRHQFSIPLQNSLRSSLTFFRIKQREEICQILNINSPVPPRPTFNMNSVYELIRKRILELDSIEFELLASYLLKTLGFEPKQQTGFVGDGGIDFEGELDVHGIASINLQVQFKRYHTATIGEREIRSFRGALKNDFQGCFITLSKFTRRAIESADKRGYKPIKLIDGMKFIELFIQQYDQIVEEIRLEENDDLEKKLRFKKTLFPSS